MARPQSDTARASNSYLAAIILSLLVCTVACMAFVECAHEYVFPRDYGMWRRQLEVASTPWPEKARMLVVGDSRAVAGIDITRLGDDWRSLAAGAITPITSYYTFRRYLANNAAPQSVVVSFAPAFLTGIDAFWPRSVQYGQLVQSEYFEVFDTAERLSDPLWQTTSANMLKLRFLLYRMRFPYIYWPELKIREFASRKLTSERSYAHFVRMRGHVFFGRANGSSELNEEASLTTFEASPIMTHYLRQILALALRHNIRVTLLCMPMNETSTNALTPEFRASYKQFVEALAADFPEAENLAALHAYPDALFGDPSHLNEAGAERLSTWLQGELAR